MPRKVLPVSYRVNGNVPSRSRMINLRVNEMLKYLVISSLSNVLPGSRAYNGITRCQNATKQAPNTCSAHRSIVKGKVSGSCLLRRVGSTRCACSTANCLEREDSPVDYHVYYHFMVTIRYVAVRSQISKDKSNDVIRDGGLPSLHLA